MFRPSPSAPTRWRLARAIGPALGLLLPLGAGCGGGAGGPGDEPAVAAPAPLTDEQQRLQVESFDLVWQTVRDRHWDPARLEALGWDRARDEIRPQVAAARHADAAQAAIRELLSRLGQSHYGLIPAEAVQGLGPGDSIGRGQGESGATVRLVEGRAVVTRVAPGSPAARAGLRPGAALVSVRGRDVAQTVQRLTQAPGAGHGGGAADSAAAGDRPSIALALALEGSLTGRVGEEVPITYEGASGEAAAVLTLAGPAGTPTDLAGMPITIERESRRLASGAAYLRLSIFAQPAATISWFGRELTAAADAPGLIIDLRGNLGGFGAMAMGMGGWLVDRPNQRLGTMYTRESRLNFVLNPRAGAFAGPVAILQDELSASTSEIFAGGLQALGRARVFGTVSAGAALPSIFLKLPSGDTLQYAIANYVNLSGQELEGRGVAPDEPVAVTRAGLLSGRDEVLEAAERWILAQRSPSRPGGPPLAPAARSAPISKEATP